MNYGNIKFNDIANGEGVRTSLFVSGCTHHCKHCFNPETWDFNYGNKFTEDVENKIIESLKPSHISGLTLRNNINELSQFFNCEKVYDHINRPSPLTPLNQ